MYAHLRQNKETFVLYLDHAFLTKIGNERIHKARFIDLSGKMEWSIAIPHTKLSNLTVGKIYRLVFAQLPKDRSLLAPAYWVTQIFALDYSDEPIISDDGAMPEDKSALDSALLGNSDLR